MKTGQNYKYYRIAEKLVLYYVSYPAFLQHNLGGENLFILKILDLFILFILEKQKTFLDLYFYQKIQLVNIDVNWPIFEEAMYSR